MIDFMIFRNKNNFAMPRRRIFVPNLRRFLYFSVIVILLTTFIIYQVVLHIGFGQGNGFFGRIPPMSVILGWPSTGREICTVESWISSSASISASASPMNDRRYTEPLNILSPVTNKRRLHELFVDAQLPQPFDAPQFAHLNWTILQNRKGGEMCMKPGTVIFVEGKGLKFFFRYILPWIQVPFVLVSGDSDYPGLYDYLQTIASPEKASLVVAWYAMNCAFSKQYSPSRSWSVPPPNFYCLPLGVSQWGESRFFMNNFRTKNQFNGNYVKWVESAEKKHRLLVSFSVDSNPDERQVPFDLACSSKGALKSISTCLLKVSREEYSNAVRSSKFVISPLGRGLDCYRTWEALYLGSFVIVKSESLNSMYENLPVWIVGDWREITESRLEAKYNEFMNKLDTFDYRPIHLDYWEQRVFSYRNNASLRYLYKTQVLD